MAVFEWARFLIGAALLLCGIGIFVVEMIGVFKFKYVLNRMHAAAMGDTLGIGFALLGLIVMNGFNFTSAKLALVIVFLWFSSPASSHLIARLEMTTNEDEEPHYRVVDLKQLEKELKQREQEEAKEEKTAKAEEKTVKAEEKTAKAEEKTVKAEEKKDTEHTEVPEKEDEHGSI